MDDIVDRLRRIARGVVGVDRDRIEAADEIERLRKKIKFKNGIIEKLSHEEDRLREALASIASNTCCDKCQEAALVAQSALDAEQE